MDGNNSIREGFRARPGWSLVGHDYPLRLLERAIAKARLAHAYLLVGPPHVGKGTLARELAQAVNCQNPTPPCRQCSQCQRISQGRHADVVVIRVEEAEGHKAIGIDAVRDLQHQAHLMPYEGRCRVYIIEDAELLTEPAANALLKILEEPPPQLLLILTSSAPEGLLATILSRCQRLEFRPVAETFISEALVERWNSSPEEARRLARLSGGRIGWAITAVREPEVLESRARDLEQLAEMASASLEKRFAYAAELAALIPNQRSTLRETLDLWATWWRDMLMVKAGAPELAVDQAHAEETGRGVQSLNLTEFADAIRAVLRSLELLELNVNPRLTLEELMLTLPRLPQNQRSTA